MDWMQILRRTNQEDIAKLVEGRLTVISAQNNSSSSDSSSCDSDRDNKGSDDDSEGSDDEHQAEGHRRGAVDSSNHHGNATEPRREPRPAQRSQVSMAQVLRDLANGVRSVRKLLHLLLRRKAFRRAPPRGPSASLCAR